MSKWWHVLATIGLAAVGAAVPPIHAAISGHAILTLALAGIWSVLGNILQSPLPASGK